MKLPACRVIPVYHTIFVQADHHLVQACPASGQTGCARQAIVQSQSTAAHTTCAGSTPGRQPTWWQTSPEQRATSPSTFMRSSACCWRRPPSCASTCSGREGSPASPRHCPAWVPAGPARAPVGLMHHCAAAQQAQQQLVLWSGSRRLRQHLQWWGGQGTRAAAQQTHSISLCCERQPTRLAQHSQDAPPPSWVSSAPTLRIMQQRLQLLQTAPAVPQEGNRHGG